VRCCWPGQASSEPHCDFIYPETLFISLELLSTLDWKRCLRSPSLSSPQPYIVPFNPLTMDLDTPDLSGLWVWSQTPESGALRQNALPTYDDSFRNFLEPGSYQAAMRTKWDDHCEPSNSRLVPWGLVPRHKNRTAWLVNSAQNRAFFDEPSPPEAPKYGLIHYEPTEGARRKRRKTGGPTGQGLTSGYKGMDFRKSPHSPILHPVGVSPSAGSMVVDPSGNAHLTADIDSDEDEMEIGAKLPMGM